MVVSALVQLAVAGPTGILFGLGYGTAIRIGYEQIYPLLFGDKSTPKTVSEVMGRMETTYDAIGGKEAHMFGINQGIKNALKDLDADTELVELIKKNSVLDSQNIIVNLSGNSEKETSEQSLSSLSKKLHDAPLISGAYAERHRLLKQTIAKLNTAEAKASRNFYSHVIKEIIQIRYDGTWPADKLQQLIQQGNTTLLGGVWESESYETVVVSLGRISKQYHDSLIEPYNLSRQTTTSVDKVTTVTHLSDYQLLQKYGGVSNQTIQLELAKDKVQLVHWSKAYRKWQTTLSGAKSRNSRNRAQLKMKQTLTQANKFAQNVWNFTHELKRRQR